MLLKNCHAVFARSICCAFLFFISSVHAGSVQAKKSRPADAPSINSPLIKNAEKQTVGAFGGISSAYSVGGNYQSALLAILPTGYLLPILDGGDVATFPVSYFSQDACKGEQYLPLTVPSGGLQPSSGLIFRALLTSELVFIPKYQTAISVKIKSMAGFGKNNAATCSSFPLSVRAFSVKKNDSVVTDYSAINVGGAVAIEMQAITQSAAAVGKTEKRNRLFDRAENDGSAVSKADVETDSPQECSVGCPADAVGNKTCDTACYVDACSFDSGDCDKEDKKELEKTMAGMCSPGCFAPDTGDGFCDTACNTTACEFDKGDCASAE
jgi:hypothetical protein